MYVEVGGREGELGGGKEERGRAERDKVQRRRRMEGRLAGERLARCEVEARALVIISCGDLNSAIEQHLQLAHLTILRQLRGRGQVGWGKEQMNRGRTSICCHSGE